MSLKNAKEYHQELEKCVNNLKEFIVEFHKKIKNKKNHNKAIVFDIDDTTFLTNKTEFGNDSIPIQGMHEIFQFFLKHGYRIFFITGRQNMYRQQTEKLLRDNKFTEYEALFMRPDINPNIKRTEKECVCYFKETARCLIEQKYKVKIIFNLGDQSTDFLGGYYEIGWKFPARYDASCMHVSSTKYPGKIS